MSILVLVCWVHIWAYPLRTHETKWIFSSYHGEILLVLLYTFHFTKNDFVIHNSKVPVYQSHHKRNVIIHPQEKCSVHFSSKSKENLLLPKVSQYKNVHDGIETTIVLKPIKYISVPGRRQINWYGCLEKAWTQFFNILTAKSNGRNQFVLRVYSL